jgi:hypothetical protein
VCNISNTLPLISWGGHKFNSLDPLMVRLHNQGHGLTFPMRKGKIYKLRSVFLLVILKMTKVTNFFNLILMKLLLEYMLDSMKIP